MMTLLQDVRYAVRQLAKHSGFAAVTVLTLALGIGGTTAIFSVVSGVLLHPLPYEGSDRLVRIWQSNPEKGFDRAEVSAPNFLDLREQSSAFEWLAAYQRQGVSLTGVPGDPERLVAALVTPDLFSVVRVEPALGRLFLPDENAFEGDRVVVLSHGLWQRRFGSDAKVLGREVLLEGRPYTVIGIAPAGFQYPDRAELWVPFHAPATRSRGNIYLSVLGRLKPGTTVAQAQTQVQSVFQGLRQEYPDVLGGWSVELATLREAVVGGVERALFTLLGAVTFVLLIACSNVANLFLARTAGRESEIAVRTALGAGRGRLIRQFLTESTILAAVGGVLGLLLAVWGVDLLVGLGPENLPRLANIGIDMRVLVFAAGITLLTGLLFGLAPALPVSNPDLNWSLKEGVRGSRTGRSGRRFRSALVVSQMALAFLLLIGAGLLIRSVVQLQQVDPGFRVERVLAFDLSLPRARYDADRERFAFYRQLLKRIEGLPDTEAVATISYLPLSGGGMNVSFWVEGRPELPPAEQPAAYIRVVSPHYFRAMGVPLIRGRGFSDRYGADAPAAVVINQAAVRRFWPSENPIGQRLTTHWSREGENVGGEVIGVVATVRRSGLDVEGEPTIYFPYGQASIGDMSVAVRTGSEPTALAAAVRRQVHQLDDQLALANVRTMEAVVSKSLAQPRFYMLVLAAFAGTALVLAAIGVYGVLTYAFAQRTRDVGIRMAVGAKTGDVLRLVLRQGLMLALAGLVVGLVAALALTRVLASLLYEVSTTDPVTFVGVALLLASVAGLASYIPARRAARVDPMTALRAE